MNWDDLRIFLMLARAGSVAEAAQRLEIDPTTVARRLARLSGDLQSTLFEASGKGIALTEHGRKLLHYAEGAEQALIDARTELTGEQTVFAGTIRVSVAEGFAAWVISHNLAEFHRLHPAIRIELVATNGFLNPSKREADLAIMLSRPTAGPLKVRKLVDYQLGVYAGRDYLAAAGPIASVDDLRRHPLIGYIPDFIYADELRYLDEIGPGLEPVLTSSSINVQHSLIASGAGVGILPCFMGEQNVRLERVLADRVAIHRSFWLVVHRDMRKLARVDAFIGWLDDVARRIAPLTGEDASPVR